MQAVKKIFCGLVLLFHCIAAIAAADPAVAMVTDLEGKAMVTGDIRKSTVSILSEIRQGSRVQLEAGARLVVVYLGSGQSWEMQGPAVVEFGPQQPESKTGAKPQLRGKALSKGSQEIRIKPVVVAQAALVLRSAKPGPKLELLNPLGKMILEEQPLFVWRSPAPKLKYRFRLLDDTGKALFETVVEDLVEDLALQLPPQIRLSDATTYTWVVSTQHPEGQVFTNAGHFRLASGELRRQVESLRPAVNSPFSERVAFAAWLEEMELRDEARKYWKAAAAERQDAPRLKVMAGE